MPKTKVKIQPTDTQRTFAPPTAREARKRQNHTVYPYRYLLANNP